MAGRTEAITIRRGLSLYKQPIGNGRGSPNWYARVYMPIGGRAIHAKSTGTSDVRAATKRAETYWAECAVLKQSGGKFAASNGARNPLDGCFDHVAERWLDAKKVAAGSDPRKIRAWQDDQYAYLAENGFAVFFGHEDVAEITTDRIREFLQFQINKSRFGNLAATTQKRSLVTLRCILESAYERRLLISIPLMPKLKVVDSPRPYFTRPQYRRLYVIALVEARKARERGDRAEYLHWMEMSDFVIFMVSTFLRPSEWKEIRHRDVKVIADGPNSHIHIKAVRGKTGNRDVHSMPQAVGAYRRIARRAGGDPNGYLFKVQFLNRQTAGEKMRDSFERLLRLAGLHQIEGKNRVSYCLRHSAIMFRILEGDNVDLLLLAKAAGTSVDQIERFYGSHLEVGMKLGNLQSLKSARA